jgi:hypothetical protein
MDHHQKLLQDHEAAWGDKVRVIGISIDEKVEDAVKHIQGKDGARLRISSELTHRLKKNMESKESLA